MAVIREWLLEHAHEEFLSFDMADFDEDCDEILEGYVEAHHPVTEDAYRNHCWQMLQVWHQDREYLCSLNLHRIIARHLRNSCRKAGRSASIESWVELGWESLRLDGLQLANEIENAIRAAFKVRAPWRDAVPKFSEELSFESLDKFHLGLENIIGYPRTDSDFLQLMKYEHEAGEIFGNQRGYIDPKVEWNIVMGSESWNITGAGCEPAFKVENREIGMPLDFYIQKAKGIFSKTRASCAQNGALIEAEVAALRLWTGPMHRKYSEVLRNPRVHSGQYVTSLHALNSGIAKLARIWRIPTSRKVYMGYRNVSLRYLKKDALNCVGGVELSVLSASEDFNVAVQYSGDGSCILEMEVGQVSRGADVSWLSQFPHEREILFNALSNIEFVRSQQIRFVEGRGTILVYKVCVSANMKCKTLEEFVSLRKDLHVNQVASLNQEARRMISLREADSNLQYHLIKSLCAECRNQCDHVVKEAEVTDVCIYNQAGPAYVKLVEDAILLPSRALQIIDLVVCWFETGEVDPAEVDRLQDSQLVTLRTAFKSSEPPQIKTIVLERCSRRIRGLFTAESLDLGAFQNPETVCRAAKLLALNPNLKDLSIEVASGTAELWEQVFKQLCPGRPRLRINGFFPAQYATVNTPQQLELSNFDIQKAAMIAPALHLYPPNALMSLSLWGSPIGCTGAEILGLTFGGLQRLRYVDLRSCKIADRGCTGISDGLPALTDLENLNLAHNNVEDDGYNILASTIRTLRLSRLKSVDMRNNDTQLPSLRCGPQCIMRNNVVHKVSSNCIVFCVVWSPGGDRIAVGLEDGTIANWDAKTGRQISTFKGHPSWVTSVAWCPRGEQIASGSWDTMIIVWDARTGEQVSTPRGHASAVTSVAWRPGGKQLASGSYDKTIIIWDAKTGDKLLAPLKGHTNSIMSVAWNPGGDQIASGSEDNTIIIWDATSGELISTLKGHTSYITSVAWRPGGDQIASGSRDNMIIIWDAKSRKQLSTLKGHTSAVTSVAWRPGGDQIASGSWDKTIIVWDAKSGEQVSTLKGHTSCVNSVAWSPGGDQITSGSHDKTIIFWDTQNEVEVPTLMDLDREATNVDWRSEETSTS